jgi:hypothetical protein
LGNLGCRPIRDHDDLHLEPDDLGDQGGKLGEIPLRPAPLNGQVVSLHPAMSVHRLPERFGQGVRLSSRRQRAKPKKSDPPHLQGPLRRGQQRQHEDSEDDQKCCPSHYITSHRPSPCEAERWASAVAGSEAGGNRLHALVRCGCWRNFLYMVIWYAMVM